ncbi:MAG: glutamate-5-semialdehyde dehydrogenase [Candidatus Omnitrophica bacterium]|nr:glutamate-5-semialdehyde dehydrogenase [Candidatus Omnitrophota bacterium]MBI5144938.1 glutamate-5-semialdehyde dehydrogenase [Candidatus Omnitrophota bacterium]
MSLRQELTNMAKAAQGACRATLDLSSARKNKVLKAMAKALKRKESLILKANRKDLLVARRLGLSSALIDRLTLNDKRINEMAQSLRELTKLPDPVGKEIRVFSRPNGLCIHKVRVPIGVIAIIYESRPNVTADCIGLCFKSGNSVILRGGSESLNSNLAIFKTLQDVLKKFGLAQNLVNLVTTTDRRAIDILLKLNNYIDLVMPRGGEALINKVVKTSRIPVIKHYKGICHLYVDDWADLNMAEKICLNAKLQRPGVCNAMESMLVHKDVAIRFLPGMLKKFKDAGVEIRGCRLTQKISRGRIKLATEKDYHTEYLDLILSVKVVEDLDAAIRHINDYGSHHSDTIVTDNKNNALKFLREVDSACVYVNASTRFTDGYQFGLGAEIGISTDKLHARGPMALEELTTYKYMVFGRGQIRE